MNIITYINAIICTLRVVGANFFNVIYTTIL
jgi:hypothetical protein